jgi:riboflavin synthase
VFTGLIQEVGSIASVHLGRGSARFEIAALGMATHLVKGESVSVDGCCLTVESHTDKIFRVFASTETLTKSTLGRIRPGAPVNLERALRIGDRLGGHFVSGHVDTMGIVKTVRDAGEGAREYSFEIPESFVGEVVPKGSIAIDGISLTIARLEEMRITVAVIPETIACTSLAMKREGDSVNVETDMIGKYVVRQLAGVGASGARKSSLSLDKLLDAGF